MNLTAPYTDVRIEVPDISLYDLRQALPGVKNIDLYPPASGPEIELTFGTAEGCAPAEQGYIRTEVERITGRPVLAIRRRGDDPSEGFELEEGWFAGTWLGRKLFGGDR